MILHMTTIFCFIALSMLSYLGARRALISQSSNAPLYGVFAFAAGITAFGVISTTLQNGTGFGMAIVLWVAFQVIWLVLRFISQLQHAERRGQYDGELGLPYTRFRDIAS